MTSKERAKLKSIAANMDAILQVGKNPIGKELIKQVDDALTARELIKLNVLENSSLSPMEAARLLSEETRAEVVQVIGNKMVLFRRRAIDDKKQSYLDITGKKSEKAVSPQKTAAEKSKLGTKSVVKVVRGVGGKTGRAENKVSCGARKAPTWNKVKPEALVSRKTTGKRPMRRTGGRGSE